MTEKQKSEIVKLRAKGMTYGDIADKLGVSINTVKSFYSRHKNPQELPAVDVKENCCKCCGKEISQNPHTREKLSIRLNARAAVRGFKHMAIIIESIVAEIAISNQDLGAAVMLSKKEFKNEKLYQTTMFIARKMIKERIITENEYHQIDTIFTEKYSPIFGTLFSDILLTSEPK